MLTRRTLALLGLGAAALLAVCARAEESPDALILRISADVLDAVRADAAIQAGDVRRLIQLVDEKVMPSVNFQRTTCHRARTLLAPLPSSKQRLRRVRCC